MARSALLAAAAAVLAGHAALAYDANVAKDLVYVAAAAYCSAGPVTSWSCPACSKSPIQLSNVHFLQDTTLTNFAFAGTDAADGSVYVSWRGSADIQVRACPGSRRVLAPQPQQAAPGRALGQPLGLWRQTSEQAR